MTHKAGTPMKPFCEAKAFIAACNDLLCFRSHDGFTHKVAFPKRHANMEKNSGRPSYFNDAKKSLKLDLLPLMASFSNQALESGKA